MFMRAKVTARPLAMYIRRASGHIWRCEEDWKCKAAQLQPGTREGDQEKHGARRFA